MTEVARGGVGRRAPIVILAAVSLLLPIDIVLGALSLVAGDFCRPVDPCVGIEQSRWQFGVAGAVALLGCCGALLAAARRASRWWLVLFGAIAIGAAAWPIVWIIALDQPYIIR